MASPTADDADSFSMDTPQSSDPDPYSLSNTRTLYAHASSTALPAHIPDSSLAHSLPLLGPAVGYDTARRIRTINTRLATVSAQLRRPLSETEQTAIAEHTARGLRIGSYGPVVGLSAGLARWYSTRAEMRWLFVGKLFDDGTTTSTAASDAAEGAGAEAKSEPKPPKGVRWDGSRLWFGQRELMKSMTPMRREALLQGFRALPYLGIGWLAVSLVVGSYAATVAAVGEMKDERLRHVSAGLRQVSGQRLKEMADRAAASRGEVSGQQQQQQQRRGGDPMGQGTREAGELWKTHREAIQSVEDDGASPTQNGFDFAEEAEAENSRLQGQGRDDGMMSDNAAMQRNTGRSPSDRSDRRNRRKPRSDDAYDDASPTGGMGAMGDSDDGSGSGSGSGSAWDRIRSEAGSASTSSPPTSASTSAGAGAKQSRRGSPRARRDQSDENSYTISKEDEERSYARMEAQKEFDERIERERQGGDFSEGGGAGKKW